MRPAQRLVPWAPAAGIALALSCSPGSSSSSGETVAFWSDTFGSRGQQVQEGDYVHVPAGQRILLDEDPPTLGGLFVEGSLAFHDRADRELRSVWILVTGALEAGGRDGEQLRPHEHRATITLAAPDGRPQLDPAHHWDATAHPELAPFAGTMAEEMILDRGLVVTRRGLLRLVGEPRGRSWVKLAATAPAGSAELRVDTDLNGAWRPGDRVIVASSDFDSGQAEERALAEVDGTRLVLAGPPLAADHWGRVESAPGRSGERWQVPEFAEVALLERNVVVRGELWPDTPHHDKYRPGESALDRGHVALTRLTEDDAESEPFCELSWAEFSGLGIEGKMGRYPLHLNQLGDARVDGERPFARDCLFRDGVHRFLSIHDTTNVELARNVGCRTLGHGFFLEGSATRDVALRDNLGLGVEAPAHNVDLEDEPPLDLWSTDSLEPSVFWAEHPDNDVIGNHAAGARGHGFYWSLVLDEGEAFTHRGAGAADPSAFLRNSAHSCGGSGFYQNVRPDWAYDPRDPEQLPTLLDFTAWKCRRYGVWLRSHGDAEAARLRLADCLGGVYPATDGFTDAGDDFIGRMVLKDVLVLGETGNRGVPIGAHELRAGRSLPQERTHQPDQPDGSPHDQPWDVLCGIQCYDGLLELEDVRFASFEDRLDLPDPERPWETHPRFAAGITQVGYDSRYGADPRNRTRRVEWSDPMAHPLYFRDPAVGASMIRNTLVTDEDGTLGFQARAYHAYRDPAMVANTLLGDLPPANPHNFVVVPTALADYAQLAIVSDREDPDVPELLMLGVNDHRGHPQVQALGSIIGADRRWICNVALGIRFDPGRPQDPRHHNGIHRALFPEGTPAQDWPRSWTVKLQFAEAEGLVLILGLPLANRPSFVGFNHDGDAERFLPAPEVQDQDGDRDRDEYDLLQAGPGAAQAWAWSGDMIFIRTTTRLQNPRRHDVLREGTRNVLRIES